MEKIGKWDLPDLIATAMSLFAVFRGQIPDAVTHGPDGEKTNQKMVSSFKAMFSKEDEGIWVSLMAVLKAPQRHAITLVLEQLTGLGEVDSFRLAVVNAPNASSTEETRDPAKPKVVVKKVVKAAEFCNEDNRVKFLESIATLETGAAVNFLRTHHLAVENPVTKHGPALVDQLTAKIPVRTDEELNPGLWHYASSNHPIVLWTMVVGTAIGAVCIAIKILFFD